MRLKKNIAILGLLAGSLVVSLLFTEAILRIAGISYPSFYIWDEYCGAANRPGARGWWKKEGNAYVTINSAGQRDREHMLAKPPNTIRIAVLGDSYAEALQLPMECTFWSVLEKELGKCPSIGNRKVEVLNFGVSGYGTAQELMALRHRAWAYDPDIILLAFLTGNDIRNNLRILERDPMRPYFVYRNGKLELDDSYKETRAYKNRTGILARYLYASVNYSRVLQVLNEFKNRLSAYIREARSGGGAEYRAWQAGLDYAIYKAPEGEWKEAWKVTEGILLKMNEEVSAKGAEFWVAILTNGIQVYPDKKVREETAKNLGVDNLMYPDMRIRDLCRRHGIPVITLVPIFQEYADRHHVFLHGFPNEKMGSGHWNENGHRLAGEIISKELCRKSRVIHRKKQHAEVKQQ